jgi:hypothetical protein
MRGRAFLAGLLSDKAYDRVRTATPEKETSLRRATENIQRGLKDLKYKPTPAGFGATEREWMMMGDLYDQNEATNWPSSRSRFR